VTVEGWQTSRSDVTYEWFLGDPTQVLGRGRTFTVPREALDRTLGVVVSVPGQDRRFVGTPTVGRSTSTTTTSLARTVSRSKRATLSVRVAGPVAATGTVKVYDGRRLVATATLSEGRAAVRLPRLSKGRHTVKAVYSGSDVLKGSSRSRTITSR
jgi:hypothetical protein